MYIKKIRVENYGAIEKMNYALPFDEKGNPIPVVLVGKNGTGKTLLLSSILHSLIEMKRRFYNEIEEVPKAKYYRVGSKKYIRRGKNFSYFRVDFDEAYFMDFMVNNYELFKKNVDKMLYTDIDFSNEKLRENGFFSNLNNPPNNVFKKGVYLYFPVDRYYIPTWENKRNTKLSFITDNDTYIGRSNMNIVQYNLLKDLETWLLDVIIDKMLYEGSDVQKKRNGKEPQKQNFIGKNTNIHNILNEILTKMYGDKKYEYVRIGVSSKYHRKISVIGVLENGQEEEIAPRFSNLSSGQIMILGIFSAIIRTYDRLDSSNVMDLKNISGIVLIDEIDAHLHSDFQKNVLPELINFFPKIQFIVSSHSPFFLWGMREKVRPCEFVALPTGTVLDNLDNFDEVKKCYSLIDDSYNSVLEMRNEYERQVKDISKPLIITEGKTDWKHLKHALKQLKVSGKFENLDIRFLEYEYDFSDSKLETLLNQLAHVPNQSKIIGVFDSDSAKGSAYNGVKNFGNNVYGCCITDTQGYNCGISIELLYSREDLTKEACDGRRVYLSDEFTNKSHQLKTNSDIVCHDNTLVDAFKRNMVKVVTSDVFNSQEESLALSKNAFATHILEENKPFDEISVNGFEKIFSIIENIVNE